MLPFVAHHVQMGSRLLVLGFVGQDSLLRFAFSLSMKNLVYALLGENVGFCATTVVSLTRTRSPFWLNLRFGLLFISELISYPKFYGNIL